MSRRVSQIVTHLQHHRMLTFIVMSVVVLGAAVGMLFIPWDNGLEVMLPEDSDVRNMIYFLRDSQLSGKVLLSFTRQDPECSLSDLLTFTDTFAANLDTPLITQVVKGFQEEQVMEDVVFFMNITPELLDAKDYEWLAQRTTAQGVEEALKDKYRQLLRPQGSFLSRLFQNDPLDIQQLILRRIETLSHSFGYDVKLVDGRIVSVDELHTLLMVETPVSFTDAIQAEALVDYLEERIQALPSSMRVDMVCSHTHTVSNQSTIQRDVQVTLSIAGGLFLLLLLFYFRDTRAGLVFVVPLASVLIAANMTAWTVGSLSPIVMGLGTVIIGIAVDYGVHIYTAIRLTGNTAEAVRDVSKPLLVGALTTIAVFLAFFACAIPGYRHMACFAFFGLLLALAGAVFILPVYIHPRPFAVTVKPRPAATRKQALCWSVVFALLLFAGLHGALRTSFDSDITQLDGTAPSYKEAEERFQRHWGKGEAGQALAVVGGVSFEGAVEKNDTLHEALSTEVDPTQLASFSRIWKSAKKRQDNVARWQDFWSPEHRAAVKTHILEKGRLFGFAADAFAPFWEKLDYHFSGAALPENGLFDQFYQRFVQQQGDMWRVITFLPDTEGHIQTLSRLQRDWPDLMVISRRLFSEQLTSLYTQEIGRVVWVALVLVLGVCLAILRDIRMTLLAIVPVAAALIAILAVMGWWGRPLNVAHLMACIVVIGLCIDYGVFMVFVTTHSLNVGTRTAVTLSSVTTLVGAGALLFAQHPTLFCIGSTVVVGITAGYLTSMLVVPALCTVFPGKRLLPSVCETVL